MRNVEHGHTVAWSSCLNTYLSCTATEEGLGICIIVENLHNGKECIVESGGSTCAFRTDRLPAERRLTDDNEANRNYVV